MTLIEIITSLKEKQGFSILYVEDELSVQQSMMLILKRFCEDITIANNGLEGWEAYQKRPFSIVITDLQMPFMNGSELIRKIRERNIQQFIIVMSAFHHTDDFKDIGIQQVNARLTKPLVLKDFLDVLEESISKL